LTQGPAAHALRPMHPCARSEARACRCAAAASFRQPAHPGHLHARRTALRRPRLPLLRLPFRGCLVCIWARTPACVRARSTSPPPQAHSLRQVPQNSALPANDLGPPPLPGSACVRGAPTSLVRGPRVTSCPASPLRSAHRTPAPAGWPAAFEPRKRPSVQNFTQFLLSVQNFLSRVGAVTVSLRVRGPGPAARGPGPGAQSRCPPGPGGGHTQPLTATDSRPAAGACKEHPPSPRRAGNTLALGTARHAWHARGRSGEDATTSGCVRSVMVCVSRCWCRRGGIAAPLFPAYIPWHR